MTKDGAVEVKVKVGMLISMVRWEQNSIAAPSTQFDHPSVIGGHGIWDHIEDAGNNLGRHLGPH